MSYQLFKTVRFGSSRGGLSTVGYQLCEGGIDGEGERVESGIVELTTGEYGGLVTIPDNFVGIIKWDTGDAIPVSASEEINLPVITSAQVRQEMDTNSSLNSVLGGINAVRTMLEAVKRRVEGFGGGRVAVVSPVAPDGGEIHLVRGDDYFASEGNAVEFDVKNTDLTGATLTLTLKSHNAEVVFAAQVFALEADVWRVRCELTSEQTRALTTNQFAFRLEAIFGNKHRRTLRRGEALVT